MSGVHQRTELPTSQCPCCGGPCEPQQITFTLRCTRASFVMMRNVPADVCQTCGEAQFTLPTTVQLMAMLQAHRVPDEVAMIPVYDLSAIMT